MSNKNKKTTKNSTTNPHLCDIRVEEDFDFVDEDEIIPDQRFTVVSFYEPPDDTITLREVFIFEKFIEECLRVDEELGKERVNFKKVSAKKLLQLYHDFRYENIDDLNKEVKEKYPDQQFERALKVRGAFKSEGKAKERMNYIKKFDQIHSQYIAEVGKWLPFNPPENAIGDYSTSNARLNEMLSASIKNKNDAKEFYEKERIERIKQAVYINEERRKKILDNDEETIMAEAKEQEMLGLINSEINKSIGAVTRKPKPSKANSGASKTVLPESVGVGDQVSTKNYKGIKLNKNEFEHKSVDEFRGDAEMESDYANSTMAGDIKAINTAKARRERLKKEDFDKAEFDEELAESITSKIVKSRT
jgi:hypothetical protein